MATANDWQIGKELKDRVYYMLQNQLTCDVTLLVGSSETSIKAHKFMLASASPVFYSMFGGSMAENGDVKLPDIEPTIFNDILKYIYTDHVYIHAGNVNGLIYSAEKYMLRVIKERCSDYLISNIDKEHACSVFQTAHDFNMMVTKKRALEYILQNGDLILQSNTLSVLSPSCLELVVGSDALRCREDALFDNVIEWGKNQCKGKKLPLTDENIRQMLGNMLYLIRFQTMDRKYFTEKVSQNKILTSDEIIKIYQSYNGIPITLFPCTYRTELVLSRCDIEKTGSWNQTGLSDCLGFSCNKTCDLKAIMVFASRDYKGQHTVSLELLQSDTVLNSVVGTIKFVAGKEMNEVRFQRPTSIMADTRYTLRLKMTGPPVFRGHDYKLNITSNGGVVISFLNEHDPTSTNRLYGQIPIIIIEIIE